MSQNTKVPHPHCQLLLDLQSWITLLQKKGAYIILLLDNNEDVITHEAQLIPLDFQPEKHLKFPKHNAGLVSIMRSCNLTDSMASFHEPPYPATYIRGKKRLDYILLSAEILPSVHRSGILPFDYLCSGDHRACFIDLNPKLLFGSKTSPIVPPEQRCLKLKDPHLLLTAINRLSILN
jgi:hypothetical protein